MANLDSPLQIFAPLSGPIVPLEQVPDPVFSQRIVGDGVAIDPLGNTLRAPCAGKIVQLHPAQHALTIETANGYQILLHIGIDTVSMRGRGFRAKVSLGQSVEPGQALVEFDSDLLALEAKSLITLVLVSDTGHPTRISDAATKSVNEKELLFRVSRVEEKMSARSPGSDVPHESFESAPVVVKLHSGLHARPAALLAARAKKFESVLTLKKGGKTANAKSLVSLISLEVVHQDSVSILAEGKDARAAADDLAKFLSELRETHLPEKKVTDLEKRAAGKTPATTGALLGVPASPGLVVGKVFQLRHQTIEVAEHGKGVAVEKAFFEKSLRQASEELADLQEKLKSKNEAAQSAIFAAHQELLEDPDLVNQALYLMDQGKSAAFSWQQSTEVNAERLAQLNNELMANRANDLRDVGRRVLRILGGTSELNFASIPAGSVLIADNLTPSDTAQLDRNKVVGFCTTTGGSTSHVAILARSLGLPAIAGIEESALQLENALEVVLDGDRGELRKNPSVAEKASIEKVQREVAEKRSEAMKMASEAAKTIDGHLIEVAANIGGVADAKKAVEMGCDGVGLLRSEFLFLERATAPTDEEQYLVYQEIADIMGERPLTIRTLDVGGDKPLRYLPLPAEENPFLGVRGIRVGLRNPEILSAQLRAILRVKSKGLLNIMFPMISSLEELVDAKKILADELAKNPNPQVRVGIMIEVPSAALIADVLAKEVDFFSIGTNDLTQYTLAMDRGHKELAKQVDALHPSVLKLIEMTVKAAHREGKWVGVCGGIAGDSKAVGTLIGLGVDELSVSVPVIPTIKAQVRQETFSQSKPRAEKALEQSTAKDVRNLSAQV